MWVHVGKCLIIVRVKACAFLPANVPARVHLWVKQHKKTRILETLQNGKMKKNVGIVFGTIKNPHFTSELMKTHKKNFRG